MSKKKSDLPIAADSPPAFVVTIGASLGGNDALLQLAATLPRKIDVAYFIVMHVAEEDSMEFFFNRMKDAASLPCTLVTHNIPICKDNIYLAPSNAHMLVKDKRVLLGHGPLENRWRPSIDTTFRSAAAAYDSKTIGIILTGKLDDGVSGMMAIQQCGGTCIIQDPREAKANDMPRAVMIAMEPDYVLPLSKMAEKIKQVIKKHSGKKGKIPKNIASEAQIAEKVATSTEKLPALGQQSVFTCPDCGGSLWHIREHGLDRYRCYTGHTYTEKDLTIKLSEKSEESLWVAIRLMEERRNLLLKMADDYRRRGVHALEARSLQRCSSINEHINRLKEILFTEEERDPIADKPEE